MEDLKNIKVAVKNLSRGTVAYSVETRHVRREWSRPGQIIPIPADEMQEAIYDNGVYNLFALGYLGIANPNHREIIGLDYEGTGTVHAPFDDVQAMHLLTQEKDLEVFKNKLMSLKSGSIELLIATACNLKNVDYNKQKIIKDVLKVDLAVLISNSEAESK